MKEEIKEILDYLKDEDEYYDGKEKVVLNYDEKVIERDDISLLLDYITNLQQERDCLQRNYDDNEQAIQKLIKEFKELQQEVEELREYKKNATRKHWQQKCAEHHVQEKIYKSKCEKAIEYIKENYPTSTINYQDDKYKLINILNGSDENE